MKKMKKGLMLLSALFLAAGIAGCGEVTDTPKEDPKEDPKETPTTPSEIATTSIAFNDLQGSGTLASPYQLGKVKPGATASSPYLVSPSDATSKTVTWAVGKLSNGAFVADTTLGVTASDPQGLLLTVEATSDATLGTTYIQGTCGSVTTYLALEVSNTSSLTSWSGYQAVIDDWNTSAAPGYRTLTEGFGLWTGTKTENEQTVTSASPTISNHFEITEDNARMVVKVRRFGQDSGRLTKLALSVNDTALKPLGYEETEVGVADIDKLSTYLVYDLTAYIGQTVEVKMTQTEDLTDATVVIQSIEMNKWDSTTASTLTSWEKAEIVSDWHIEYASEYRSGTGEGFDFNTYDNEASEFIYNYLTVTNDANILTVKVRRFSVDSGTANKCKVLVNGTELTAMGYVGTAVIEDTDGPVTSLAYDLSAYAGQTVQVVIMQPVAFTGHLVITSINQTTLTKTVSEKTDWNNRNEIADDWNIEYASDNRDISEGFDFNTFDGEATEFIYNYIAIPEKATDFTVALRRFGQDNGNANAFGLFVNGKAILAKGQEDVYKTIEDTDGIVTYLTYDLSAYAGQTVQIVLMQPVAQTGHLVIMNMNFVETSTLHGWDKEAIKSDWNIDDAKQYRDINEGFDLNTNDGDKSESISNVISVTAETTKLLVKVRRFGQDGGKTNKCIVTVNGVRLTPMGYTTNDVEIPDLDTVETCLVYDLSAFVNNSVTLKIEQPVENCGHLVIMNVEQSAWDTTASTLTHWDKSTIISDWNIDYAADYRTSTGEGFDLNTNDHNATEFIYNYLTITEQNCSLTLQVRRFGQDNGNVNKVGLFVNGQLLNAYGLRDGFIQVPDVGIEEGTLISYDLSDYIGQTVQVVIMQPVAKTGHLVLMSINMGTSLDETVEWNKEDILSQWDLSRAGNYASYNEGVNLDTTGMENGATIAKSVTVTQNTSRLLVKVRGFGRNGINAVCKVYVNGRLFTALGYDSDEATVYDLDTVETNLVYDLSEFVGHNVYIEIQQAVPDCGQFVIMQIKMDAWHKDEISSFTTWANRDAIAADWNYDYASQYRSGTGEGFDLNTNDNDATEFIYNYVTVPTDKNYYYVAVRRFNQDNDKENALGLFINGNAIKAIGSDDNYFTIADTDGEVTYLKYDLSEYAGQTVQIVLMQPVAKTGHLVIMRMGFIKAEASTYTSWNKDSIISDWDISEAKQFRNVNEGFDLNTNDGDDYESVSNVINVTANTTKLLVKVRRFNQDGGWSNKCIVYINETKLIPLGYNTTDVEIIDADNYVYNLVYDLSDYVGQTVTIRIEQPVKYRGHLVIMEVTQSAWNTTASTLTSWTKDTIKSDWNIEYASDYRDNVGEGFDMNTFDNDGNEFIYNYITVTEETKYFVIKVRRFGQDDGKANAVVVNVDGKLITAIGQNSAEVTIEDNGDSTILVYDLSAYVGKTVRILIGQPVAKTGHLVITELGLEATAPTSNQDS